MSRIGPAGSTGLSWRDAAALGTRMNTRGLMELIVLNIGLDLGVISTTLFAMMIVTHLKREQGIGSTRWRACKKVREGGGPIRVCCRASWSAPFTMPAW